jgi:hypothetical protein
MLSTGWGDPGPGRSANSKVWRARMHRMFGATALSTIS